MLHGPLGVPKVGGVQNFLADCLGAHDVSQCLAVVATHGQDSSKIYRNGGDIRVNQPVHLFRKLQCATHLTLRFDQLALRRVNIRKFVLPPTSIGIRPGLIPRLRTLLTKDIFAFGKKPLHCERAHVKDADVPLTLRTRIHRPQCEGTLIGGCCFG